MLPLLSDATRALSALATEVIGDQDMSRTKGDTRSAMTRTTMTTMTTSRVYTIRFAPTTRGDQAGEDEIVDWQTEVIDGDDGRVECITTPVYASAGTGACETIETTEVLDMAALLERENVCAVTCEETTRTTVTVLKVPSDTAATIECEEETQRARDDQADSHVDAFEIHQGAFGVPLAFGCFLRQFLGA